MPWSPRVTRLQTSLITAAPLGRLEPALQGLPQHLQVHERRPGAHVRRSVRDTQRHMPWRACAQSHHWQVRLEQEVRAFAVQKQSAQKDRHPGWLIPRWPIASFTVSYLGFRDSIQRVLPR